jgi:hypothetical protein
MSEPRRIIITPGAWEGMLAEAKASGFGKYMFGSVYGDGNKPDRGIIHFHTLVPAAYYANAEALAASPIRFTRNRDGDILLPGRWWQELLAWPPVVDTMPPETIQRIRQGVAGSDMVDAVVPKIVPELRSGADLVQLVSLSDLSGRVVTQEVLLPGTEAFVPYPS